MTLGVTLLLDDATTAAIRGLWQAQADAGLPPSMMSIDYPPHITLVAAVGADMPGLRSALRALANRTASLPVSFLALGVFPAEYGVVYLSPCVNQALLDLQSQFWLAAGPHLVHPMEQYRQGIWVPHVTLAFGLAPEVLGAAAAFLAAHPWPTTGTITGFLYGDFQPTGVSELEPIPFEG